MKRLLFVGVLSWVGSLAQAQVVVNGVDMNTLKEGTVISIEISEASLLNSFSTRVDYGQKEQQPSRSKAIEEPETAKAKKFNSPMAVVNFMIENGWEYLQAVFQQPQTISNNYDYRYFFRKKLSFPNPER